MSMQVIDHQKNSLLLTSGLITNTNTNIIVKCSIHIYKQYQGKSTVKKEYGYKTIIIS